ncbi:MAG: GNAT family N-acetyltransferase [Candidatus Jordarchaeaceae archaeon]
MFERYDVRVFNKIEDLGRDSLDAISDDPFFTYEWFKTLEEQKDFKIAPFYIAAYHQGELVAFTPCFVDLLDHYFSYCPPVFPYMNRVLRIGNRLKLWNMHVLLCYSPFCFRSKILVNANFKKSLIYSLICLKINEICKKERILFSVFPFIAESDLLLTRTLGNFNYLRFPWLNTLYLPVNWYSFDEYLASFKCSVRRNIRREIMKFNQSGLKLEEDADIIGLSERLSVLYAKTFGKYNRDKTSPYGPSFFSCLGKFCRDKIKLFTAKSGSETVAFCLCLRHRDVADAYMFGSDYNFRTNTDFAYFNLAYYEPIKWAIRDGIGKIFYRLAAEDVKLKLGCKPEKTITFVKCHNKFLAGLVRAYVYKRYGFKKCNFISGINN